MKATRLGCISGSGILITLIALLLISGIAATQGGVLFNPGPLNAQAGVQPLGGVTSHAETGGRCSACHTAVWENEKMADRCLNCHQELVKNPEDFHKVMLAQSQSWACYNCHTEHTGNQGALTIMDLNRFPHDAAGYSLKGHQKTSAGADFTCSDCHGSQIGTMEQAVCIDCHQQIDKPYIDDHLAAFGNECLVCHDGLDTYGKVFNHNLQAFPLQGEHATALCSQCHAGARTISDLQNTAQACIGCHAGDDAHQGRFGEDCAQCHTADRWQDAAFDHSLAAFPLTGAHQDVACESCHLDGLFTGTSQACSACHSNPVFHQALFGSACAACHHTDGWLPALFDREHTFPFNHGESGMNTCRACHPDSLAAYNCYTCHEHTPEEIEREHREEGIFDFQDCTRCHPTGYKEEGGVSGEDDD